MDLAADSAAPLTETQRAVLSRAPPPMRYWLAIGLAALLAVGDSVKSRQIAT